MQFSHVSSSLVWFYEIVAKRRGLSLYGNGCLRGGLVYLPSYGEGDIKNEDCKNPDVVSKCGTHSSDSGGFFPDTQQKLRDHCKRVMIHLDCVKRMANECISEYNRRLYYNLTHEMMEMNEALCSPGSSFNTRFLKHVECYKNQSQRFGKCSEIYISNMVNVRLKSEEEQTKMTCCTVEEYDRCMRNAIEGRCDADAQKLVRETVVTVLKQTFNFCNQYGNIPTSDCLHSLSATKSHATGNRDEENGYESSQNSIHQTKLVLLLLVLVIAWS